MKIKHYALTLLAAFTLFSGVAAAADHSTITPAVGGYDLVSYHQTGGPVVGTGHHLANHEGNIYAFVNADNKATFEADPSKYLPAYGGYCAYGASLGKKFYGDPAVYEVVNGTLYLNLDKKVQSIWVKNKAENIVAANTLWSSIKYVPAAEL